MISASTPWPPEPPSVDGSLNPRRYPYIHVMTQWQKPTREPPKTKSELREMLAEAVRNTQPEPKKPAKSKKDRG